MIQFHFKGAVTLPSAEDFPAVRDSLVELLVGWCDAHRNYMFDGPWACFQVDFEVVLEAAQFLAELACKYCPRDAGCSSSSGSRVQQVDRYMGGGGARPGAL